MTFLFFFFYKKYTLQQLFISKNNGHIQQNKIIISQDIFNIIFEFPITL